MQCPFCKAPNTRVIDSRLYEEGTQVRRRRECEACGNRFTSFEKAQLSMPLVLKRSGMPEPFDEDKLRRGIESALYKRAVVQESVDHAIETIMRKLRASGEREVPSRQIGEWVMDELRDLDHVAYVRFASIYRAFEDVNAFREEIDRLEKLPSAELRRSQLSLIAPMFEVSAADNAVPARTDRATRRPQEKAELKIAARIATGIDGPVDDSIDDPA